MDPSDGRVAELFPSIEDTLSQAQEVLDLCIAANAEYFAQIGSDHKSSWLGTSENDWRFDGQCVGVVDDGLQFMEQLRAQHIEFALRDIDPQMKEPG